MQILQNPGFEEGKPNNWQTYATGIRQKLIYPEIGRTNGLSVAIEYQTVETGEVANWNQTVQIDSTKKYKLSGWLRTENIIGNGASIKIDWKDGNDNYLGTSAIMSLQKGTVPWKYFEGTVVPNLGATKAVIILELNNCSGKVWFDDISIIDIKYKCVDGSCIEDSNGQYNSIEECQSTIKYACINNQCVTVCPDYQGTKYNTLADCQAVCELKFEDNFNGTELDTTKWTKVDQGTGLFKSSQVRVSNSNLIITGVLINGIPKSGWIRTTGKFTWKYGKIEYRAKFAHGNGARNQMWCYKDAGTGKQWSINIEDGVSATTYSPDNRVAGESATGFSVWTPTTGNQYKIINTKNFWQNYHIFQAEWTPQHVIFRIDGIEQWRVEGNKVPTEPLDINMALCLGKCGATWAKDLDRSQLPFEFMVDYVKIYKI